MPEFTITTGARLHFGLFSHGPTGRREFGGVGLMIDSPGFVVRGSLSATDELRCGPWQPRVATLLARLRAASMTRPVRLEIVAAPPAHAGLGSGTQLGMALAKMVSLLGGEPMFLRLSSRGVRDADCVRRSDFMAFSREDF